MVSSVIVKETVSQILSGLVHKCEGKEKSHADTNMERLEMAHIRLEAALEISNKWLITDASLLRWRKKLKLATQECDDALHKCKRRMLEEEQMEQEVRNSSFPTRMAHATRSFIFSTFSSSNKNKLSRSTVQRFEWFADGASEFLRFVELGGTPRRQMPVNSMIKPIFAGSVLHHKIVGENNYPLFLLSVVPFRTAEHGIEAGLSFIRKDRNAPENDFFLTKDHWDNLHSFSSQWFRPNPLCCKQHEQHKFCHSRKVDSSGLQDVSLEPVIEVNLQCQVSFSEYNKQRTSMFQGKCSLEDSPHLKVGLLYTPHDSSDGLLPADRSSAATMIDGDGDKQHCRLHPDMTLEQVEEVMLPKAIGYFSQNTEATAFQMLWKSRCGTAYIQVEKERIFTPRTRRTFIGERKRKTLQRHDQELENPSHVISHFVDLWATQAPIQLQVSIMDWFQKEKEKQLVPQPLRLKSNRPDLYH
ncbi:unnamed protein product [Urochloa decumbens]|uniref:Rx N-terminal domain-containing protein n=1 Tax=Urochloa decumbens TaxID=240449 RepID=A0ABC9GDL1_9POAL